MLPQTISSLVLLVGKKRKETYEKIVEVKNLLEAYSVTFEKMESFMEHQEFMKIGDRVKDTKGIILEKLLPSIEHLQKLAEKNDDGHFGALAVDATSGELRWHGQKQGRDMDGVKELLASMNIHFREITKSQEKIVARLENTEVIQRSTAELLREVSNNLTAINAKTDLLLSNRQ